MTIVQDSNKFFHFEGNLLGLSCLQCKCDSKGGLVSECLVYFISVKL